MKNFFDYKDEKITEKAFSQGLLISVLSILLSIVALCSVTYAWFTSETTSNSNTLRSGCFDITVSVTQTATDATATVSENKIEASDDGSYLLKDAGTYSVTLNPTDDATVKGYCIVTIDHNTVYKTDVILDEDMVDETYTKKTAPFTFTIVTEKADTVVTFVSHWGILLKPDIDADEVITVTTEQNESP